MKTNANQKTKRTLFILAALALLLALALAWLALRTEEKTPSGSAKFVFAGEAISAWSE